MSSREISFYVDTLLVERALAESHFYKKAGFISDLLSRVKEYFGSKIDPNNPAASVLDELAPGALWMLFRSLGIGKWGMLLGLLMNVFHVDVYGILQSLYGKVKEMVGSGKKVSSSQIDQAVNSTVQEHSSQSSPEEAQEGFEQYQKMKPAQADDHVYSSLELMHDAKMISLAMIQYEKENLRLTTAANRSGFLSGYSVTKAKGSNLLGKIFGWIIKIALASAGLMVAGDIVNKFLGRPNSLDGTYHPGQTESETSSAPEGPISTQTKYPLKNDSPLPSSLPIVNNSENISNMIIQFAKDVYSGLDGKEDLIKSTPGFQMINEKISWYNQRNEGSSLTFIPPVFHSKKQLVDYFIDDVAKADSKSQA